MNTQRAYIQLRFEDFATKERIEPLLYLYDPLGLHEDDDAWYCYFDEKEWVRRIAGELLPRMRETVPEANFQFLEVMQRNWNEEWERTITPIRVSDRFVISPSWHSFDTPAEDIRLIIDPKMSFGTGYHATTRLMVRLLESCVRGGERVLDVGTGTGVLAIAAIKLGAAQALGVDTDEWSRDNAVENLERNDVADGRVEIRHGSLDAVDGRFHLIAANITRNDNIAMLPHYASLLEPGGMLVVSGFYEEDLPDMDAAAHELGFSPRTRLFEDEWAAASYTLTSPGAAVQRT